MNRIGIMFKCFIIVLITFMFNSVVNANDSNYVYVCDDRVDGNEMRFYVCRDKIYSYFGKVPTGNTEWECIVRVNFQSGPMKNSGGYYGDITYEYRLSNDPRVSFIDFRLTRGVWYDDQMEVVGGHNNPNASWIPVKTGTTTDKIYDVMLNIIAGKL